MRPIYKYLLIKLSFLLATYFVAVTIAFVLPRIAPGNPVQQIVAGLSQGSLSPELLDQYQKRLVEEFGLNKPLYVQYLEFLKNAFSGDLGTSISSYRQPVTQLIAWHLPWTLLLLVPATLVAWTIGNYLGARAAYRRGTLFEKTVVSTGIILSQIPYYWMAMVLIYVFAIKLGWLPSGSAYDPTLAPSLNWEFIKSYLRHYILPFLSIALVSTGGWIIGMRVLAAMELGSTYVKFSEMLNVDGEIIFRYVLRNSLLPQVTGIAIQLGTVMAGQIITEQLFNYQGMGILLARALGSRDYPMIQGIFLILIGTLLLANFIVEFIYVLIDPRIRLGARE
ncbi:ABC transporter permease [Thermococcus pacificus]|uniref:Peptide ABC transporter permease n=1 Tax=Thermococcus pacificus TaxID=71998 RepID=A0A218P8I1_9EURY|nr:ABC transporter permease [Thermococcus pacificus]ASJ07078.1 peptide ABC transporter permease [Thermococcus pacificus]